MVNDDPLPPWFSGLGLVGECASQYELEQSQDGDSGSAVGQSLSGQASDERNVLRLEGLAPITIFVGANNSGKSRLMREIFSQEQFHGMKLSIISSSGSPEPVNSFIEEACHKIQGSSSLKLDNGWLSGESQDQRFLAPAKANQNLADIDTKIETVGRQDRREDLQSLKMELLDKGLLPGIRQVNMIRRWYIPILRGMRPPLTLDQEATGGDQGAARSTQANDDPYVRRTKHDYFRHHPAYRRSLDSEQIYGMFSGLSLFADLRRRLLGRTQSERDSVRQYEDFLADNFFGGSKVTLVPVEEDGNDVVHIKIGNKEDYPIYQLGDGLQSLIICTYPIVTEQKPGSLFFIEEPDLGMHPSLQRSFVNVLMRYHRKMGHQFFLTTHSNHLLDLLEDDELVSIFSFSEKQTACQDKFRIRRVQQPDREVLMQLGVRPSATYLANATIWVEGPSDCAYLRTYMEAFIEYLEAYGKDFGKNLAARLCAYNEDRHYAFVEYSGANLVHFDFAEVNENATNDKQSGAKDATTHVPSLCAQSIVIADGDIAYKGDRIRKISQILGERFILLPGKEIENLIAEELVRLLVKNDLRSKSLDESLDKVLGAIGYAGYARKLDCDKKFLGLGKYLDQIIEPLGNRPIKKYTKDESGTLESHSKARWAKRLSELMRRQLRDHEAGQNSEIVDLPPWLNQDILWLMVLVYEHISHANYDADALKSLRKWKQWIRQQVGYQVVGDQWPIPDPADDPDGARKCLLTAFLVSNTA